MKKTNKRISRLLLILISVLFSMILSGCAGTGRTSAEVHRAHQRVIITEHKQFQDDIDDFWMIDRPSRLSDKYTR